MGRELEVSVLRRETVNGNRYTEVLEERFEATTDDETRSGTASGDHHRRAESTFFSTIFPFLFLITQPLFSSRFDRF